MTTKQKAEAYDEVVNKLRRFMEQGINPLITRADVQDFFPELCESEDEKIRKSIISLIQNGGYMSKEDKEKAFAWLEKQGEQNFAWSEDDDAMLDSAIKFVEHCGFSVIGKGKLNVIAWLKELKDKVQPPTWKPSEDQLKALSYFITSNLPRYNESTSGWIEFDNIQSLYNDLKKLREE